jgi:orotate phosphoribosyltransferase-like protein
MKGIRRTRRATKLLVKKCQELHQAGTTVYRIAKMLNMHHTTILYHLGLLTKKNKNVTLPNVSDGDKGL